MRGRICSIGASQDQGTRQCREQSPRPNRRPHLPILLSRSGSRRRLRFGLADDCVILFIPSHARDKSRLKDQAEWASQALDLMGTLYGGATAFRDLCGIWRDDDNGGQLLTDNPIMIQSLAKREDVEDQMKYRRVGGSS